MATFIVSLIYDALIQCNDTKPIIPCKASIFLTIDSSKITTKVSFELKYINILCYKDLPIMKRLLTNCSFCQALLLNIPGWDWRRDDQAVCLNEVKYGLLAQVTITSDKCTYCQLTITMVHYPALYV